jgi:FkbM family methyltransferase
MLHLQGYSFEIREGTNDESIVRADITEQQYKKYCRYTPSDIWLDIGGHIGSASVAMSAMVKQVYVYEPEPSNYVQLCRNLAYNDCKNVIARQVAVVGGQEQEKALYLHQGTKKQVQQTGCHSFYTPKRNRVMVMVPCANILDLLKETHARNLKIDVEGAEADILDAITDWESIDEVILEWHPTLVGDRTNLRYHRLLSLLERVYGKVSVEATPFEWGQVIVHARKESKQ